MSKLFPDGGREKLPMNRREPSAEPGLGRAANCYGQLGVCGGGGIKQHMEMKQSTNQRKDETL